jgi:hypothetical protein
MAFETEHPGDETSERRLIIHDKNGAHRTAGRVP